MLINAFLISNQDGDGDIDEIYTFWEGSIDDDRYLLENDFFFRPNFEEEEKNNKDVKNSFLIFNPQNQFCVKFSLEKTSNNLSKIKIMYFINNDYIELIFTKNTEKKNFFLQNINFFINNTKYLELHNLQLPKPQLMILCSKITLHKFNITQSLEYLNEYINELYNEVDQSLK